MCDCIEKIDKLLAESKPDNNTKLDIPFTWSKAGKIDKVDRVRIVTTKRDDKVRKKPISIQPAYCPFCGIAYEDEENPKK
jgi:predicted Zn-ribbon and HTH transcriptional regulator